MGKVEKRSSLPQQGFHCDSEDRCLGTDRVGGEGSSHGGSRDGGDQSKSDWWRTLAAGD